VLLYLRNRNTQLHIANLRNITLLLKTLIRKDEKATGLVLNSSCRTIRNSKNIYSIGTNDSFLRRLLILAIKILKIDVYTQHIHAAISNACIVSPFAGEQLVHRTSWKNRIQLNKSLKKNLLIQFFEKKIKPQNNQQCSKHKALKLAKRDKNDFFSNFCLTN
jgi:hypothetical protein